MKMFSLRLASPDCALVLPRSGAAAGSVFFSSTDWVMEAVDCLGVGGTSECLSSPKDGANNSNARAKADNTQLFRKCGLGCNSTPDLEVLVVISFKLAMTITRRES